MDRVEEAILAFIGTAEVRGDPNIMMSDFSLDRDRVQRLIDEGMIEGSQKLTVTVKGWQFLDGRSSTTSS